MSALIIIGIILAIAVYVIAIYNSLQSLKTMIKASIQEIGNQLKRQASLIPNLEASVKGYLKHEKGIYEMITTARKSVEVADKTGSAQDIDKAIDNIQALMPKIQVAVESNPELKANTTVNKFMDELTDTADKLTYARRSVIDLTQSFNEKLVVFPSNIIANLFGFKEEAGLSMPTSGEHLNVSQKEMEDVKVNL
ncbi:MAG: LemA family protein [Patescibacteria group bacterium]